MSKIPISEALKLVDVSKTTLYRDLKENKLSSTTDAKGRKVIDPAELERFYGQLKTPAGNGTGTGGNSQSDPMKQNGTHGNQKPDTAEHNGNADATPAVIAVLEDQVVLLKTQLESERQEKGKLLDMLAIEQEKTKMLMLPMSEPERIKKKGSWLGYFRLKR